MRPDTPWLIRSAPVVLLLLQLLGTKLYAEDTNYFVLVTLNSKQSGEFLVNGFPVAQLSSTNPIAVTSYADPILLAGTNQFTFRFFDATNNFADVQPASVTVRLEYGPEADEEGVAVRTNIFELTRALEFNGEELVEEHELRKVAGFRYLTRGFIGPERTLQTIILQSRKTEYQFLTNAQANITELQAVLTQPRLESLPWLSPAVALTDDDRAQIRALVRSFHAALMDKNFNAAADLLSLRLQRLAAAFGTTLGEQRQKLTDAYTEIFAENFQMDPLDEAKLQFKNWAPANLIQIFADGKHPISGSAPEYSFQVPVYVSKVDGAWRIVE